MYVLKIFGSFELLKAQWVTRWHRAQRIREASLIAGCANDWKTNPAFCNAAKQFDAFACMAWWELDGPTPISCELCQSFVYVEQTTPQAPQPCPGSMN